MQSNMKKVLIGFFLSMLLVLGAAAAYIPEAQAAGTVKNITVKNLPGKTLTLRKGKTITLKTKVTVQGKKVSKQVTFKSSNPKVATVTAKGLVKAKKAGKANITIASKANKKKKIVIKVTVGTPVSKVSLNTSRLSLAEGASATLKASVTPKKASNKKVIWSSSNQSVATVSSEGIVKAIKAGTAKLTAEAADGSGKKASCTVTVSKSATVTPVKVASVSALNPCTIEISLTGSQTLSASNFTVKAKITAQGAYNKICAIDNISTRDKVHYTVVLKSESRLHSLERVQVTVTGLTGTGTSVAETLYDEGVCSYQNYEICSVLYNETFNDYFYLDGEGYLSYTVTGLPRGIHYSIEESDMRIRFTGKPTQKGTITSKISTKDELGNTYEYTIVWLVYSEDTIAAAYSPSYLYMREGGYVYINEPITTNGGSGNYQYSISGDSHGLEIDEYDGMIYGEIDTPSSFTINVVVQDTENAARKITVPFVVSVVNSRTITGTVKDARGNGIYDAYITFVNKDKGNRYLAMKTISTDEQGHFTTSVVDGTYDIQAMSNGVQTELYSQTFRRNRSDLNITLPLYEITVTSNNAQISSDSFTEWTDESGDFYGYGDKLYLKVGTYTLTSEAYQGRYTFLATLHINVNASTTTAVASVTMQEPTIAGDVTLEQPLEIKTTESYIFFRFVPSESGLYYFYTDGNLDTYGRLEDEEANSLTEDDDSGIDYNFEMEHYCEANTVYYVGAKCLDGGVTGNITLHVSTQSSQPSEDDVE